MREILFRAKAINREEGREYRTRYKNGDWVYGLVTRLYDDKFPKIPATMTNENGVSDIDIDYKTIGQYTELKDKNGKKIFEGDIVVMNIKGYNTICKVAWADNVAQFQLWQTNTIPHTPTALNLGNYDCEIIGNIHDNPELLKGGEE